MWRRNLVSRSRDESRTGKVGRAASTKTFPSLLLFRIRLLFPARPAVESSLGCRVVQSYPCAARRSPSEDFHRRRARAIFVGDFVNHFFAREMIRQ